MFPTFFISAGGSDTVYGEIGCGTYSLDYDPSVDTPGVGAGWLAVAIIRYSTPATSPCVTLPSGWELFLAQGATGRGWAPERWVLAYKVLTSGDLSTTHTFEHIDGAGSLLCGTVFAFSDFHPIVPLDNYQYECSQAYFSAGYGIKQVGYLGGKNVTILGAKTFDIAYFSGASTGTETDIDTSLAKYVGGEPEGLYSDFSTISYYRTQVLLRTGTESLVNLLSDENWNVPCANWSSYGLTTADLGPSAYSSYGIKVARLISSTASGRHYIYKTVSLTAGQKYTFTAGVQRRSGGYAPYESVGMGVVPPSGSSNEFGMACAGYGSWGSVDAPSVSAFTDPESGREDWWWGGHLTPESDGLPNFNICRYSLAFIAQETGTYTLRLYVPGDGSGEWSSMDHTSAVTTYVAYVALIDGIAVGAWLPGSALPDYWAHVQSSPSFLAEVSCVGGHTSFQVNPSGSLPPARLAPYTMGALIELDSDGLGRSSTSKYSDSGNDGECRPATCNRNIYPTIDGVATKYYAEWTFTSGSSNSAHNFGVAPLHVGTVDLENESPSDYRWSRGGTFYVPSGSVSSYAWSASAGDKFGVMVDYDNAQVVFYKNGSVAGTANMYNLNGINHAELPFMFSIALGGFNSTNLNTAAFEVNFSGPFSYLPTGAVAWDVVNEVS